MSFEYVEYRSQTLKSAWPLLAITASLSIFSIFIMFLLPNVWVIMIMLLPALSLPFVVVIIRANRVRLGIDFIETSTLFRTKRLAIDEVQGFGTFYSGQYTWPKLTDQKSIDNVNDDALFGHQVYLSTNPDFDLDSFRPKKHIKFPYKRELYLETKKMLENKTAHNNA